MKTELTVVEGNLVIETVDGNMEIKIDIPTGQIVGLEYAHADINTINTFLRKAKTRYNKFLTSEQAQDFVQ